MKKPETPPKYSMEKLAKDIASGSKSPTFWLDMLGAANSPVLKGKYVHWDKLRRLPPPGKVTHEQWWAGLKFQRSARREFIDLLSINGDPSSYVLLAQVHESLRQIDMRASGMMGSEKAIPGHSESKRYLIRSLITAVQNSANLS